MKKGHPRVPRRPDALLGLLLCGWSVCSPATEPPYLAVTQSANLSFGQTACTQTARESLREQGFAKISVNPRGGTVFAAYHSGPDYRYKAVIKCLEEKNTVTVVVVAEQAGGLNQARALLAGIGRRATPLAAGAEKSTPPPDTAPSRRSRVPDCGHGPALIRCLNQIPRENIPEAVEYLENLEQIPEAESR